MVYVSSSSVSSARIVRDAYCEVRSVAWDSPKKIERNCTNHNAHNVCTGKNFIIHFTNLNFTLIVKCSLIMIQLITFLLGGVPGMMSSSSSGASAWFVCK
jgi:hypothetical protein